MKSAYLHLGWSADFILHPNKGFNDQGRTIQGDRSGCSLGLIDIKTKVAFQYMLLILKQHNFCLDINNTWGTTRMVTLYSTCVFSFFPSDGCY